MAVLDLERVAYRDALDLQHRLVRARRAGAIPDTLVLLEHPPVLTVGRAGGDENVVAPAEIKPDDFAAWREGARDAGGREVRRPRQRSK